MWGTCVVGCVVVIMLTVAAASEAAAAVVVGDDGSIAFSKRFSGDLALFH